jgi:hypothetical protein
MNTDKTQDGAGAASRWNGVPVAWAAVGKNGVPMWLAYHRQDAGVAGMAEVVPLYRSPTLTNEEREVLELLVFVGRLYLPKRNAEVIQGLLDRLK